VRPTLPPLWLETPDYIADLRRAGVARIPSASALRTEMAEFESEWQSEHATPDTAPPSHLVRFGALQSVYDAMERLAAFYDSALQKFPVERRRLVQRDALSQWYSDTMFRWSGSQVYVVDPHTFGLLARTELPKMPASELRLPREAFYLLLPDGLFEFESGSDRYRVVGVTVTCAEHAVAEDGSREVRLWIDGRKRATAQLSKSRAPTFLEIAMHLRANQTIDEMTRVEVRAEGNKPMVNVGSLALDSIPKVVVGLCLYLMSEHPHLEPIPPAPRVDVSKIQNPAKLRKAERRNDACSRFGYIRVGRDSDSVEALNSGSAPADEHHDDSPAGSWRLDHQVWVRGHWRLQASGEGLSEHRLIWIRPHTKGPDLAESEIRAARVQPARLRPDAIAADTPPIRRWEH
jgi:hypothetical protein